MDYNDDSFIDYDEDEEFLVNDDLGDDNEDYLAPTIVVPHKTYDQPS